MRVHAKAVSAGSTKHRASGLGRFFRGAFATRGASGEAKGSGAPKGGRRAHSAFPAGLVAALALLAFAAAPAGAVIQRPFQETFGSAEQPSFLEVRAMVFDQSTSTLLVAETSPSVLRRFNADGTPANFSALGTNVIDGKGPGADQMPQGVLTFRPAAETQLAIDESGGVTDGNIYVTQPESNSVIIFASDGSYLGRLTAGDGTPFGEICGVSVDANGVLYVGDYSNGIFKFVPTANPPINTDSTANFKSVPEQGKLAVGAGPTIDSLFANSFAESISKVDASDGSIDYVLSPGWNMDVTVDPATGHVFVIPGLQAFGTNTEFIEYDASGSTSATKVTEAHTPKIVTIAVNSAQNLVYVSHQLDNFSDGIDVYGPPPPVPAVATSLASNLTANNATLNATVNPQGLEVESCVFEWGETTTYDHTTPCAESSAQIGEGNSPVPVHADIGGLSGGTTYHYRIVATNANGTGEGSDMDFDTTAPPLILEEAVQSASRTEATLSFKINPKGFPTRYHIEYGKADQPYEHSTVERSVGADSTDHALTFTLEGLTPGTAYHWRIVATNADPDLPGTGTTNGDERKFHTHGTLGLNTSCPNQAFRTGSAAALPDCRAYEMVSPVDKNGGDILGFLAFSLQFTARATYDQASIDGNKMTYSSGTPFGDTVAGRNSNQYMATRGSSGWTTHSLNAPGGPTIEEPNNLVIPFEPAFTLFTPDLSEGWMQDGRIPPLTSDAVEGMQNFYRRDNLSESYQALTNEEPPVRPGGISAYEYPFLPKGHSADFDDVLFTTRAPLTPDAFPTAGKVYQTYDSAAGDLHLVSFLPDGSAYPLNNSMGNFLSGDGSLAFWTGTQRESGGALMTTNGAIFLRENPTEPQSAQALGHASGRGNLTSGSNEVTGVNTSSGAFAVGQEIISRDSVFIDALPVGTSITAVGPGSLTLSANAEAGVSGALLFASSECTEPDKACTIPVSQLVPKGDDAEFQFASTDGSRALFRLNAGSNSGDLYEFDVATRTPTLIAHESAGVVGGSDDASRIYFVSKEDLATGASAGESNLYLRQGGVNTFIATFAAADVGGGTTSTPVASHVQERGSRVSPDGSHLLFMSESKALAQELAGYDNTDAISGKADREVYLYEVGGELRCISCNPSGARPRGQRMEKPFYIPESDERSPAWAAAWFPGWEHELLAQRVMSDDGDRVFFNAYDALVPGDTNGAMDVYEWELPGTGDCTTTSSSYSEQNGGCVNLISSGQSPRISEFIDATPDGHDVFFSTGSSLLPQDPGLIDIYDARTNGGFPQPPAPAAICEGEACQGAPTPPNDPTPASAAYNGPGNVNEAAKKKKKSKKHKKKNKHKKQKKKGGKAKRQAANNSTRRNG